MSAIEAVTRNVKTLADGTMRLSVDISPIHAQEAFKLFGMPDVPLALARLHIQATQAIAQAETIQKAPPITGLAFLAIQWCKQPQFWDFLNDHVALTTVLNEQDAKDLVCLECGIDSRKELNTDAVAAEIFERTFRQPCIKYLAKQEAKR